MNSDLKILAFYLPQFHPIPENDKWWGKGFTEWTNVVKAKPLFKGHDQPKLPADLGFYDLRLPEVRQAQVNLAKEAGIYGFCYYHYWFNGKRLLHRPFEEVLNTGKPDFPFMLCWANENWTRIWDGGDKTILQKQTYTLTDAVNHIQSLLPAFYDKRYIRINNKPVFAVYRSSDIPNLEQYIEAFRKEAQKNNIELYLCRVESFGRYGKEYLSHLFDAAIEFAPFTECLDSYKDFQYKNRKLERMLFVKVWHLLGLKSRRDKNILKLFNRINYSEFVNYTLKNYKYPHNYTRFPGVTPAWDNTARRGESGFLFKNANPEKYGEWLSYHVQHFIPPSKDENFIFINAWNEWAEGNFLEPSIRWSNQYLEITKRILSAEK